jgi:hypothetical protein
LFEQLVAEEPTNAKTWLRLGSLRRQSAWADGDAARVKAELMERSWRPDYFKK